MRRRFLVGVLALAALVGTSIGLMEVAAAPQWSSHSTPLATLGWNFCHFSTLQLVYYDNNTSESVDLDRAGQYVRPTSDECEIRSGEMEVTQGDGTVPTWQRTYFPEPVVYPSSYTQWWDQHEETYYKYDEGVTSYTAAGPGAPDAYIAGWQVIFWPNGDITDDELNKEDK